MLTKTAFDDVLRNALKTFGMDDMSLFYDNIGYSIEALEVVLNHFNLKTVITWHELAGGGVVGDGQDDTYMRNVADIINDNTADAFICGTKAHWYAIVKKQGFWFQMDSLNKPSESNVCGMKSHAKFCKKGLLTVKLMLHKIPRGGAFLTIRNPKP
jgi:hypothetical protein